MKIVLAAVNAKFIHTNLALYDLKSYAETYGQFTAGEILIREYTINQLEDEIFQDLYKEQPDVICFSCYIWNIAYVTALVPELGKVLPNTEFWAGGPEVSFDAKEFLQKNPSFYGVMRGEGEEIFRNLAEYYQKKPGERAKRSEERLSQIQGIVYRKEDAIVDQGHAAPMDLSRVPFAYEDMGLFKDKIVYYESSRGCPFSCSYCLSSVDKNVRFRDIELVKKELQFFLDQKVPQVKFVDRTFNCRHSHSMAVWQYLIDHDNGITNFHFELAADLITEEELCLMEKMRPGLIQLEIGVQSTNPKTIREIHRIMDFRQVCEIVKRIHSYGNIHVHLDLIAGLPYEDYDSFHRSFLDVYALHPNQLQLGFLKVLKGSYLAEKEKSYGILRKDRGPYEVLSTNWISYGDVLRLKQVESMVEVYYNSGQFTETLSCLEEHYPDMFVFFEKLAAFYEECGYFKVSHSRLRRYEILLEFLEKEQHSEELLLRVKDAMMTDLYLRERLKKTPSFAVLHEKFEKAIWEYRREHQVPRTAHVEVLCSGKILLFDYEKRDPLTHNAAVYDITEEVKETGRNV